MEPSVPAGARRSLLAYNLLFPLVFLAMLPGLAWRMVRRGGARRDFGQRLGIYSGEKRARFATGRWWWIHSISVGETLVALKLAQELHRREPALQLVITVTTSTGYALARQSAATWLEVLYNPIDARSIVRTALDLIRPERLILIEGEAWPNLLAAARARRIPVALVNARLSPRSERRFLRARFWVGPIFDLIDLIAVPEDTDPARWQRLGVAAHRLHVTGSIKFDSTHDAPLVRGAEFRALLASLSVPPEAPILLAGSTWAPEEKVLAEVFADLRREIPALFLIVVPRHIERAGEIARELSALGLRVARRSAPAAAPCDVLLVDTTGELREWYALATVVFVGKSLPGISAVGGQNPAEPAALGKALVAGPHMENFAALVALLASERALATVADADALLPCLRQLLVSPADRNAMGRRARAALDRHAHSTARTAALLLDAQSPATGH
jgi:3-deoxy-D-manno-octulosonic-acid transferase